MDAEAAALAMAEAALQEAAERERLQQQRQQQPMGGMASMPPMDAMDTSFVYHDMHQQQQPYMEQQFLGQDAELLQNLMNMPDDESRNQLLQHLLQQEQLQQTVEAARMRPQTHHLTISKEGKISW